MLSASSAFTKTASACPKSRRQLGPRQQSHQGGPGCRWRVDKKARQVTASGQRTSRALRHPPHCLPCSIIVRLVRLPINPASIRNKSEAGLCSSYRIQSYLWTKTLNLSTLLARRPLFQKSIACGTRSLGTYPLRTGKRSRGSNCSPAYFPERAWWTKYKNPEDILPGMRPILPKDQKKPDNHNSEFESNLFWGPTALGAGIVLAVVAAMKHDLRWLLYFAAQSRHRGPVGVPNLQYSGMA